MLALMEQIEQVVDYNAVFTTDYFYSFILHTTSLNLICSIPITINEPVNKITFSSDSEYLYALSSTHVSIPLVFSLDYFFIPGSCSKC